MSCWQESKHRLWKSKNINSNRIIQHPENDQVTESLDRHDGEATRKGEKSRVETLGNQDNRKQSMIPTTETDRVDIRCWKDERQEKG